MEGQLDNSVHPLLSLFEDQQFDLNEKWNIVDRIRLCKLILHRRSKNENGLKSQLADILEALNSRAENNSTLKDKVFFLNNEENINFSQGYVYSKEDLLQYLNSYRPLQKDLEKRGEFSIKDYESERTEDRLATDNIIKENISTDIKKEENIIQSKVRRLQLDDEGSETPEAEDSEDISSSPVNETDASQDVVQTKSAESAQDISKNTKDDDSKTSANVGVNEKTESFEHSFNQEEQKADKNKRANSDIDDKDSDIEMIDMTQQTSTQAAKKVDLEPKKDIAQPNIDEENADHRNAEQISDSDELSEISRVESETNSSIRLSRSGSQNEDSQIAQSSTTLDARLSSIAETKDGNIDFSSANGILNKVEKLEQQETSQTSEFSEDIPNKREDIFEPPKLGSSNVEKQATHLDKRHEALASSDVGQPEDQQRNEAKLISDAEKSADLLGTQARNKKEKLSDKKSGDQNQKEEVHHLENDENGSSILLEETSPKQDSDTEATGEAEKSTTKQADSNPSDIGASQVVTSSNRASSDMSYKIENLESSSSNEDMVSNKTSTDTEHPSNHVEKTNASESNFQSSSNVGDEGKVKETSKKLSATTGDQSPVNEAKIKNEKACLADSTLPKDNIRDRNDFQKHDQKATKNHTSPTTDDEIKDTGAQNAPADTETVKEVLSERESRGEKETSEPEEAKNEDVMMCEDDAGNPHVKYVKESDSKRKETLQTTEDKTEAPKSSEQAKDGKNQNGALAADSKTDEGENDEALKTPSQSEEPAEFKEEVVASSEKQSDRVPTRGRGRPRGRPRGRGRGAGRGRLGGKQILEKSDTNADTDKFDGQASVRDGSKVTESGVSHSDEEETIEAKIETRTRSKVKIDDKAMEDIVYGDVNRRQKRSSVSKTRKSKSPELKSNRALSISEGSVNEEKIAKNMPDENGIEIVDETDAPLATRGIKKRFTRSGKVDDKALKDDEDVTSEKDTGKGGVPAKRGRSKDAEEAVEHVDKKVKRSSTTRSLSKSDINDDEPVGRRLRNRK